jgi:hypothetical protein
MMTWDSNRALTSGNDARTSSMHRSFVIAKWMNVCTPVPVLEYEEVLPFLTHVFRQSYTEIQRCRGRGRQRRHNESRIESKWIQLNPCTQQTARSRHAHFSFAARSPLSDNLLDTNFRNIDILYHLTLPISAKWCDRQTPRQIHQNSLASATAKTSRTFRTSVMT